MSRNPAEWAEQSRTFLTEVQVEWKKVTWPSQKDTVAGTVSVIAIVVVIGLVLFAADSLLAWLMRLVL